MRRFLAVALLFMLPAVWPAAVSAQEFNQTITIYATVPEQRAIYLDDFGGIIRIAGNTTANIPPRGYDSSNHEVTISPAIQRQYDKFLAQHGGHLQAGVIYNINPLKVDNSTKGQTISFENSSQTLSLSVK